MTWYRDSIRYFQGFGFYTDLIDLPDDALVERVAARVVAHWDVELPADPLATPQLADLFLLSGDAQRVWWHDLECVYRGAEAYAGALREWATISRSAFAPEGVVEAWAGDAGPVLVTCTVRGVPLRFIHPDGHADFLDMRVLRLLNGALNPAGPRFALPTGPDPNVVIALTTAEQARLRRERGWDFLDFLTG